MNFLIAGIFVVVGAAMLWLWYSSVQTIAYIVRKWIVLQAVVIDSDVKTRGLWARVNVCYEYRTDNDVYFEACDRTGILRPLQRDSKTLPAAQFSPGDKVTVFVNPDNHQESVLFLTRRIWICAAWLLIAGVSFCLGVLAFILRT